MRWYPTFALLYWVCNAHDPDVLFLSLFISRAIGCDGSTGFKRAFKRPDAFPLSVRDVPPEVVTPRNALLMTFADIFPRDTLLRCLWSRSGDFPAFVIATATRTVRAAGARTASVFRADVGDALLSRSR